MPNITSSIVLYKHSPSDITGLIQSILNCKSVIKLFLVDNSPTDVLKVLATDSRIEYVFNNANIGYGAGHNIALRKSIVLAKYHAVVNPDIAFEDGTLESICAFMELNPDIGQIMPKIIYPDGRIQHLCKLLPSPVDLIIRRFLPSFLIKKRTAYFEMHRSGYDKIMEVPFLSGCFMFLRLETLQKVGLFDEQFFMYPEDVDLTRRIHEVSKTIFFPYARVVHGYERGSYKSLRLLWIHITNMIKYFNKWGWIFDAERKRINKQIEAQYKQ